ncbi:hypothetical protein B0I37DRAFT_201386 [Chaetomium sp. MPI-CAGE-AT-0009]|nr:hypothetical protein B0I37DRAFT_201386 [Chaetomium sp. MPI-CAGE-AT-0009]
MRPARALFPLLTVAAAGVGVASGQFTTSTVPVPDLAPRHSDAATLAAREHIETVRRIITRTIIQNTRRPSPTGDSNNDSNNDDNDDNEDENKDEDDDGQRTPIPTRDSTTPTSLPSPTSPTSTNDADQSQTQTSSGGLSAGAAAGITAAAVAGVAIIAAVVFLVWRRRQGGIRGAVVTADYPRGMGGGSGSGSRGMEENGGGAKSPIPPLPLPPPSQMMVGGGQDEYGDGDGYGYGYGEGVGYAARGVEEQDLGEGRSSGGSGGSEVAFRIPPAGTMPGEQPYGVPGGYPTPQQQQQQQRPQQLWLGGDLGEARPVSAFTVYPSPGPILPVSPMTPYRPESSILMSGQQPQSRIPSYYPDPGSPGPPAFLIPGGNRARAMSFSSVSHVGGGPRVAELVGSPPPPVPSMMVIVEGEPPIRSSHAEMP